MNTQIAPGMLNTGIKNQKHHHSLVREGTWAEQVINVVLAWIQLIVGQKSLK